MTMRATPPITIGSHGMSVSSSAIGAAATGSSATGSSEIVDTHGVAAVELERDAHGIELDPGLVEAREGRSA